MHALRTAYPSSVRLRDAAGTLHEPADPGARIVCLVPSITELICDLGLAGQLVGRTGFCVHPWETVRTIPKLGGTKEVKVERIRELAPTHAVVNIDENRREVVEALAEFVPHIVVTHPLGPLDNLDLYRLLGAIFGREAEAERLCQELEHVLAQLRARPSVPQDVLYLIWRDPWMAVAPDTYIARMLALVGWRTHPLRSGDRYPTVTLEKYAGRLDRVLLSSEPFHFKERHLAEVGAAAPGAVVSLIDGEMTSWYGSRAIQGVRYLAEYAGLTSANTNPSRSSTGPTSTEIGSEKIGPA
jgi:ABC-type Fe3+-citrate transport system substrate-binding protein